jgi:uncharacterized membrane protein YeaQ/YmgE (transglycosylase-associated protein family)
MRGIVWAAGRRLPWLVGPLVVKVRHVIGLHQRGGIMEFIWFIVVGLVAGWLAGLLVKGGGFGVVGDIVVGVLGALLGGFLFSSLGASMGGGLIGSIVVATIGAVILIFVLRLIKRA